MKFNLRGVPVIYDAAKQEISVGGHLAQAPLQGGKISLTVFTGRTAYEIFAADGLTYIPMPVTPDSKSFYICVRFKRPVALFRCRIRAVSTE